MGLVSFERSGSFLVGNAGFDPGFDVEYLVVAGGASGGGEFGGGGGAGGYLSDTQNVNINTELTVTIGAGGASQSSSANGNAGSNSTFSSNTAIGGGFGANRDTDGGDGGSGGGGGGASTNLGGSGTVGQGNDGGAGRAEIGGTTAGGGGGASAQGGDGLDGAGGSGGAGSQWVNGSYYAGGGGGSAENDGDSAGAGGQGGGGNGARGTNSSILAAQAGQTNTGGGGGGAVGFNNNTDPSGAGGSGIVILRYPASVVLSTASGLTGTTTTVGQNKVTQITAGTGNISFTATGAEAFPEPPTIIDPATLSPQLWLDASDASTITASGGSVSQWSNKGSLSNFSQGNSSLQPTTGASTINGLNVLDFNIEGFVYDGAKGDFTFMHNGTQFLNFLVMNWTGGDNRELLGNPRFTPSSTGFGITVDDRTGSEGYDYLIFNGTGTIQTLFNGELANTNTIILSALFDPDNSTAADRVKGYENDSAGADVNEFTGTPSSSEPFAKMILGSGPTSGGDFQTGSAFTGQIAEWIVISGANATEENRVEVVTYLKDKWGIF